MSEQPDRSGLFTWIELGVPDLDAAARFYGAVFGWELAEFAEGYRTATSRGRDVGGLYLSPAPVPDGVRVYVSTPDLEATLAAVTAAGGTVVTERTEIAPDEGWWADFRDPFGTLVGILTANPPAGS